MGPRELLLACAGALTLSGCTFFYVPADKSAESIHKSIPFVRSEMTHPFNSYGEVAAAVSSTFASPDPRGFLDLRQGPPLADSEVVLEFLQVSDAQVRDETVYNAEVREQQGAFDFLVS